MGGCGLRKRKLFFDVRQDAPRSEQGDCVGEMREAGGFRAQPAPPAPTFSNEAVKLDWLEAGVALVTMTRGAEMNTLTLGLIAGMAQVLDIAEQAKARALIVTGSDRAFCCGAHIRYFTSGDSPVGRTPIELRDNYLTKIALLYDRFEAMPFPTIAAIRYYRDNRICTIGDGSSQIQKLLIARECGLDVSLS